MLLTNIEKSISWQRVNDVVAICDDFAKLFKLTYFDYGRLYPDGSVIALYSSRLFATYLHQLADYQFPATQITPGLHMWQSFCSDSLLSEFKENFNMDYMLTYYQRYDNYIEVFDFATQQNNHRIMDLYLNQQDLIHQFTQVFKDKAQYLIVEQGEYNKRLLLPKNTFQTTLNKTINTEGAYLRWGLTAAESRCLHFIKQGLSAKQIARQLNISYRTVELHTEHIKHKLGCQSKAALISFVNQATSTFTQ